MRIGMEQGFLVALSASKKDFSIEYIRMNMFKVLSEQGDLIRKWVSDGSILGIAR